MKLYPHQEAGVAFLATARTAILADEMGVGKSATTASTLRLLQELGEDPLPALVICPNSVKLTWKRELEAWVPGVKVQVVASGTVAGAKSLMQAADVYVMNWDATRNHSRLAPYGSVRLSDTEKQEKAANTIPWRTVIADEAHKLKNPKAKWTRAAWWLARGAEFRFALTGTPIANHPGDLWGLLHFINPDEWPAKTKYTDRFCLLSWNQWGGMDVMGVRPDTRDEFFAALDPRFRRMPKSLVLPFLPPKTRTIRDAEMKPKQAKAYRQMQDDQVAKMEEGDVVIATNNLTRNLRLLQFSSSYAELDGEGDVLLSEPSNKLNVLEELMEELGWQLDKKAKHPQVGEPLVIFAMSRQLIMLAAARLNSYGVDHRLIVGGLTDQQRQTAVDDFQSGRCNVILLTIQAGGEGLTLTRAQHAVFLQRSWSMLANKQAEDRVHRIGSEVHDNIHIIDLVTPDTVEGEQIIKLHEKAQRLEEIVRDKEAMRLAGDLAKVRELEAEEDNILSSELDS